MGRNAATASLAPLVRALSSLLGVGGGKEAVLEGPILLGRLVFAMELARLREHTLNARRRGRAAKELACHLGKNRQAVLLTILSFPPGQHIQVDVFLDRQREVLIKLVFVDLERYSSVASAVSSTSIGAMGKSKKELDAPFAASLVSAFVVNVGEGVVTPVVVGVGVGATGFQLASHTAFS